MGSQRWRGAGCWETSQSTGVCMGVMSMVGIVNVSVNTASATVLVEG